MAAYGVKLAAELVSSVLFCAVLFSSARPSALPPCMHIENHSQAHVSDVDPLPQAFLAAFGAIPSVVAAYKKYDLPANNEMSWTTVALGC